MAKQAPPVAATEPAPKEPAAEPEASQPAPTVADLLAERDLRIEELSETIAKLEAKAVADLLALEAKEAALQELSAKLVDAREEISAMADRHEREVKYVTAQAEAFVQKNASKPSVPSERLASVDVAIDKRRCVALARMRTVEGWLSAGDAFEASDAELEGYKPGTHYELED